MNFTWKGRETGEMEIQCDDDLNTGYIKFTSEHECEGMFGCAIIFLPPPGRMRPSVRIPSANSRDVGLSR